MEEQSPVSTPAPDDIHNRVEPSSQNLDNLPETPRIEGRSKRRSAIHAQELVSQQIEVEMAIMRSLRNKKRDVTPRYKSNRATPSSRKRPNMNKEVGQHEKPKEQEEEAHFDDNSFKTPDQKVNKLNDVTNVMKISSHKKISGNHAPPLAGFLFKNVKLEEEEGKSFENPLTGFSSSHAGVEAVEKMETNSTNLDNGVIVPPQGVINDNNSTQQENREVIVKSENVSNGGTNGSLHEQDLKSLLDFKDVNVAEMDVGAATDREFESAVSTIEDKIFEVEKEKLMAINCLLTTERRVLLYLLSLLCDSVKCVIDDNMNQLHTASHKDHLMKEVAKLRKESAIWEKKAKAAKNEKDSEVGKVKALSDELAEIKRNFELNDYKLKDENTVESIVREIRNDEMLLAELKRLESEKEKMCEDMKELRQHNDQLSHGNLTMKLLYDGEKAWSNEQKKSISVLEAKNVELESVKKTFEEGMKEIDSKWQDFQHTILGGLMSMNKLPHLSEASNK